MNEEALTAVAEGSEKQVLGAMIESHEAVIEAQRHLCVTDFFVPAHRIIWVRLLELGDHGNLPALVDALMKHDEIEQVGGSDCVVDLAYRAGGVEHIEFHAGEIIEARCRREGAKVAKWTANALADGSRDPREVIAEAAVKLGGVTAGGSSLPDIQEDVAAAAAVLRDQVEGKTPVGLVTRWETLNEDVPIRRGTNVAVCGPTSSGKSLFAGNICADVLAAEGRVVLASYEMSKTDLIFRFLSDKAQIPPGKLFAPHLPANKMDQVEAGRLEQAQAWLSESDLHIFDDPCMGADRLAAMVRVLHAQKPVDLLVVDYLQLLPNALRDAPREQQVAHTSRILRGIGLELGVTVIALSQVNEQGEVRESRAIKQDTEILLHIEKDGIYVAKNRNGQRDFMLPITQEDGALRFVERQ